MYLKIIRAYDMGNILDKGVHDNQGFFVPYITYIYYNMLKESVYIVG